MDSFCKPCRDASRVTRADVRIDAVPMCVRCICGERPISSEHLTPEPRLLRKPPIQPLYPEAGLASPGGIATAAGTQVLPPSKPLRVKEPRCWELGQTHSVSMVSLVLRAVEFEFGLAPGRVRERSNRVHIVQPRQLAMLVLNERYQRSYSVIGRAFSMHHTTVMYSVRAARARRTTDAAYAAHAQRIDEVLERVEPNQRVVTSWFQQQARRDSDLIREMKNVASLVLGFAPASELNCNAEQAGVA